MTINSYIILTKDEYCRCSQCDKPLSIGDVAHELDGRPFCGGECAFEYIGRAMARLHGAADNGEKDANRF